MTAGSSDVSVKPSVSGDRASAPARSMVKLLSLIELMMTVEQIGVTAISRQLGIPVASAFRLLKVLEYCGYAEQLPEKRSYRLTLKLFEIGCHVASNVTIRDVAAVDMERLARQTGLAVNLGVLVQGELLYLDKIQTDDILALNIQPGMRVPAHCTALGKAILSSLEASPRDVLGDDPYASRTPHSISSLERLQRELDDARRSGYAVDRQELSLGIWCVAAPIVDGVGNVHGAISVSALRANMEEAELADLGLLVLATARKVGSRIRSFRAP